MTANWKRRLFWWLCEAGRVPEGQELPRWLVVVRWILTPIEMARYCIQGDMTFGGVMVIGGRKFSILSLERMLRPGKEWFRVVGERNGWPLMETRRDEGPN